MPRDRDRFWVFDRPVHHDGLFWMGLMLGLINAFFATSSFGFADLSLAAQSVSLAGEVIRGLLLVAVIGGTRRWLMRGFREARSTNQHQAA